jgi:hypothetical protein
VRQTQLALVAPRPMAEASGLAVRDLPFESPLLAQRALLAAGQAPKTRR